MWLELKYSASSLVFICALKANYVDPVSISTKILASFQGPTQLLVVLHVFACYTLNAKCSLEMSLRLPNPTLVSICIT